MKYSKNVFLSSQNDDYELGVTKVCVRCGRIFNYLGFGHYYCPPCRKKDIEDFTKVKEYIYEHGVATALEVSDNTGVSLKTIEQYLREGRLEIPENSPIFIKCEKCSINIRSGRLCPQCATSLSNAMRVEMNFDDEQIGEVPKMVGKMRFFGKDKN
jgi:RNA polymerase subunit RPABC4/transcription elongation factor Spt4